MTQRRRVRLLRRDTPIATLHRARIGDIVRAIAAYLLAHPSAADTAEGVARCWLGPRGLTATTEDVQVALNRLVARGVVEECQSFSGAPIYRGTTSRPSPEE